MGFSIRNAGLAFTFLAAVGFGAFPAFGQEKKKSEAETSREIIENLLKRVENLEKQLKKLKGGAKIVPTDKKNQKVLPLLESMHYGPTYYSSSGPRFFAAKLILVNLTPKEITVKKEDVQLQVANKLHKIKDLPANIRSASFYAGTQQHSLSSLKTAAQMNVKPGGTASTWIIFSVMIGTIRTFFSNGLERTAN